MYPGVLKKKNFHSFLHWISKKPLETTELVSRKRFSTEFVKEKRLKKVKDDYFSVGDESYLIARVNEMKISTETRIKLYILLSLKVDEKQKKEFRKYSQKLKLENLKIVKWISRNGEFTFEGVHGQWRKWAGSEMVGPEEESEGEEFLEVVRPAKKRGEPRQRESRVEPEQSDSGCESDEPVVEPEPKRGRQFEAEQLEPNHNELELLESEQLEPEQLGPRVQDAGEHGQKAGNQIRKTLPGGIDDFVWEVNMETLEAWPYIE